ncbi:MAG: YhcG family protein, partial [Candidatus Kapaibacterium sp.]
LTPVDYEEILSQITDLLDQARTASAKAVNSIMTATYWSIGRHILLYEQKGGERQEHYGKQVVEQLSVDLSKKFGRGFGRRNLFQMRAFYLAYSQKIVQTLSAQSSEPYLTTIYDLQSISSHFPLSWSHYVRLLSVRSEFVRTFYETEALRGGWTVRQLDRQINAQFYERVALSRNKAKMLRSGEKRMPEDTISPEEEIKDPFILEFLGLKDEYSESELEEALIRSLESFLLELGQDFTFVGRQRRLRVGDSWFRIDLLLYHRRLRCLVIVDLKIGKFTHADAGQMHMYLNYAAEHWTHDDENPPIGLILCTEKNAALAHYTLDNLPNTVLAAEYRTVLPDEHILAEEVERIQNKLQRQSE